MRLKECIDIVFTWVDPENEAWNLAKARAISEIAPDGQRRLVHAYSQSRFNSNLEELKYALRSIERHLIGSVRKIFLVTNNGSVPGFIDLSKDSDPSIEIIDYRTLLGRESFCSRSIESVLHKIPGLSEHFLYFNDDMILNEDLDLRDWFSPNGQGIWYQDTSPIIRFFHRYAFFSNLIDVDGGVVFARHRMFKKLELEGSIPPPIGHNPRLLSKSLIEAFIERFNDEITVLREQVFRSPKAFCFLDAYCYYYANQGKLIFIQDKKTAILIQRNQLTSLINRVGLLIPTRKAFICIADIRMGSASPCSAVKGFLDRLFPQASRWE